MVTEKDVINAYLVILGRKPENSGVIKKKIKLSNVQELNRHILNSEEFKNKFFANSNDMAMISPVNDKLVFLHIPKCAGTTLHQVLVKDVDAKVICNERFNGLKNWPLNYLQKFKIFSGHFDYNSVALLNVTPENIITILRDPIERLISLYYFLKSHKLEFARRQNMGLVEFTHNYSIEEFFSLPEIRSHPSINNTYTRTLVTDLPLKRWEEFNTKCINQLPSVECLDKANAVELACSRLSTMSYLTMADNFDGKLNQLLKALGLEFDGEIKRKQVLTEISLNNPNLREVEVGHLTPELKNILQELVKLDYEIYSFAKNNEKF
jgi:hypothetical protein